MSEVAHGDTVELVPNGGWDPRLLICRCAPTVDTFIVVTMRYVIVIDTMLNPATATALLDIARPYLHSERSLLAVNTHADWDHCWGNQLFAGPDPLASAPIVAHARCAARFGAEMAEELRAQQATDPGRFGAVRPTPPTITFDDRLTIDGGDLTLKLFPTPGHTVDHVAIFIPEIATLLAGDAAEEPFPFATTVEGLRALRASLHTLQSLPGQAAFYCHAPESSGPSLIERNLAYFAELERRCRTAMANGSVLDAESAQLEEKSGWHLSDLLRAERHLGALMSMYREGHRRHIALMLQWLKEQARHQKTTYWYRSLPP